jgi:hypothetical protein
LVDWHFLRRENKNVWYIQRQKFAVLENCNRRAWRIS